LADTPDETEVGASSLWSSITKMRHPERRPRSKRARIATVAPLSALTNGENAADGRSGGGKSADGGNAAKHLQGSLSSLDREQISQRH
jgi:hypothetical protein